MAVIGQTAVVFLTTQERDSLSMKVTLSPSDKAVDMYTASDIARKGDVNIYCTYEYYLYMIYYYFKDILHIVFPGHIHILNRVYA
jgi:hypothetical protein